MIASLNRTSSYTPVSLSSPGKRPKLLALSCILSHSHIVIWALRTVVATLNMKSLGSRNLLLATLKLFSPQISRKWNGVVVPNNMFPLCILPCSMSGGGLELPQSRSAGNWAWFTQLGGVIPTLRKPHPAQSGHKAVFVGFPSCSLLSGLSTKFLWVKTQDHYCMLPGECKWLRHICGDCWVKRRKEALHSEGSKECPLSASSVSKN